MKPGEPWGSRRGAADLEVSGTTRTWPGCSTPIRGRWCGSGPTPGSDLARAVGHRRPTGEPSGPWPRRSTRSGSSRAALAVNGVVLGTPPRPGPRHHPERDGPGHGRTGASSPSGPATTVVVANGQFFDGLDVVPAGPSRRRADRGAGLRAAPGRAPRDAGPAAAGGPPPAPAHRDGDAAGRSRSTSTGGRLPLTIDGVARGAGQRPDGHRRSRRAFRLLL